MKYLYIFVGLTLLGCYNPNFGSVSDYTTKNNLSHVEELKVKISSSFDRAEKEVFKNPNPLPKPDDGTNPDPAKCICGGTGIIVQGDGHKTACPYHAKQKQPIPILKR